MAFADDYVQCLSQAGITVDVSVIPDSDTLSQGLGQLATWFNSLDGATQAAFDEVTADQPVKAGLADPTVGIAPNLGPLLQAVDQLQASISISSLLTTCQSCLQQVTSQT
jgi:hypothetical protein